MKLSIIIVFVYITVMNVVLLPVTQHATIKKSILHHYKEQQDSKVIPMQVRLQTCLVLYNFPLLT
jgi:hypothetical protein